MRITAIILAMTAFLSGCAGMNQGGQVYHPLPDALARASYARQAPGPIDEYSQPSEPNAAQIYYLERALQHAQQFVNPYPYMPQPATYNTDCTTFGRETSCTTRGY